MNTLLLILALSAILPSHRSAVAPTPTVVEEGGGTEPPSSNGTYVDDIGYAIWMAETRVVDAESPAASNGSYVDDIAHAIWTAGTRTLD